MTAAPLDEQLEAALKGTMCARCESEPQVIALGFFYWPEAPPQTHAYRCNCGLGEDGLPIEPVLMKRGSDQGPRRRLGEMTLARMDKGVAPAHLLTREDIQAYINPKATDAEAEVFLRFCHAMDVNPFINEAYLIKYDETAKAAIVLGIATLLKRASRNPGYKGYESGVIVEKGGELEELQGSMYGSEQKLVGGWAIMHNDAWAKPMHVTVKLEEYMKMRQGKPMAQWGVMPGTMIEKTALSQGLRRMYPDEIGAVYEDVTSSGVTIEVSEAPGQEAAEAIEEPAPPSVTTSEGEPANPRTGEILDDPLKVCPRHKVEWRPPQFKHGSPFHPVKGDSKLCVQRAVFQDKLVKVSKLEDGPLNDYLKDHYDGATKSRLTPEQLLEAIAYFEGQDTELEDPPAEEPADHSAQSEDNGGPLPKLTEEQRIAMDEGKELTPQSELP